MHVKEIMQTKNKRVMSMSKVIENINERYHIESISVDPLEQLLESTCTDYVQMQKITNKQIQNLRH